MQTLDDELAEDPTHPPLVLAVALLIAPASMWAFYTSEGAAKARERATRLEDALASGIRTLGPTLDFDPGAYVQPGTPIAEILDLSQIELIVLVGDRQIDALRPGTSVTVRADALGSVAFTGRVARVAGAPQDGSQRYPVVVLLDNAENALRPGMLAQVLIDVGPGPKDVGQQA